MLPYVEEISPQCANANRLASQAALAINHAESIQQHSRLVLREEMGVAEWLQDMSVALLATSFKPHGKLISNIIQTLITLTADQAGSASWHEAVLSPFALPIASDKIQALLQHPVDAVSNTAWATVCEELNRTDPDRARHRLALIQLLANDVCFRFVFSSMLCGGGGNHDLERATMVLSSMVSCGVDSVLQGMLRQHTLTPGSCGYCAELYHCCSAVRVALLARLLQHRCCSMASLRSSGCEAYPGASTGFRWPWVSSLGASLRAAPEAVSQEE
jgi:hypothetical protein